MEFLMWEQTLFLQIINGTCSCAVGFSTAKVHWRDRAIFLNSSSCTKGICFLSIICRSWNIFRHQSRLVSDWRCWFGVFANYVCCLGLFIKVRQWILLLWQYCFHVAELLLKRVEHLLRDLELHSSRMVLDCKCVLAKILNEHLVLWLVIALAHL